MTDQLANDFHRPAGRDPHRHGAMPRLVESDLGELRLLPRRVGALHHRGAGEHAAIIRRPHIARVTARGPDIARLPVEQRLAGGWRDRHLSAPRLRLRISRLSGGVYALRVDRQVLNDVNAATGEVNVLPPKRSQLARPQATVERGRPEGTIVGAG